MNIKKKMRLLSSLLAAGISCSLGNAIEIHFSQDGLSEGATIEGSFVGEDLDTNGYINYFPFDGLIEVSDFNLSFSGNSIIDAFTLGFADLNILSFKVGGDMVIGNDLGDFTTDPYAVEGISAGNLNINFNVGQGPLGMDGIEILDLNTNAIVSSPMNLGGGSSDGPATVPDSGATVGLLGFALAGVLAVRRRFVPEAASCR